MDLSELKQDIYKSLEQMSSQTREDQAKTILLLVQKYVHTNSTPFIMSCGDFEHIKQLAHQHVISNSFPKYIDKKSKNIDGPDIGVISIIEGTISFLSSRDCFKKDPKFNYIEY